MIITTKITTTIAKLPSTFLLSLSIIIIISQKGDLYCLEFLSRMYLSVCACFETVLYIFTILLVKRLAQLNCIV